MKNIKNWNINSLLMMLSLILSFDFKSIVELILLIVLLFHFQLQIKLVADFFCFPMHFWKILHIECYILAMNYCVMTLLLGFRSFSLLIRLYPSINSLCMVLMSNIYYFPLSFILLSLKHAFIKYHI